MTCAQERETTINWNDAGEMVGIYTASQPVANRCTRQGFKLEKIDTIKGEPCSWWFSCPKNCISLRRIHAPRIVSIKLREKARLRALASPIRLRQRGISLETQATANQEGNNQKED